MTLSPMARLLSVLDPAFLYAEHRRLKALNEAEVFYYQGTGFIEEVERRLVAEIRAFIDCVQAETRVISGQMANMAVYSALVDYLNRDNRRDEPRRLRSVVNNHILRGGHLSAQPMGALRDFMARDPATEAPAVTSLPVLADDPCRVDTAGLAGPHFQEPFQEGADVVTGSTHKTFLGTLLGLLVVAYEMNSFREVYQPQVLATPGPSPAACGRRVCAWPATPRWGTPRRTRSSWR